MDPRVAALTPDQARELSHQAFAVADIRQWHQLNDALEPLTTTDAEILHRAVVEHALNLGLLNDTDLTTR